MEKNQPFRVVKRNVAVQKKENLTGFFNHCLVPSKGDQASWVSVFEASIVRGAGAYNTVRVIYSERA